MSAHIERWRKQWEINNYKADRCIKGTVDNFMTEYKRIMQSATGSKEVWLVTTGLSKSVFEVELTKERSSEQIPQLMLS